MFADRTLWTVAPTLLVVGLLQLHYPSYLDRPGMGQAILTPWATAVVVVVLLGALIPPLGRALAAREVVRQRAIGGVALSLALVHGWWAARLLAEAEGRPAPGGASVVIASVVGAVALVGIAARSIDLRGFGGGFMVLVATSVLVGTDIEGMVRAISEDRRLLAVYGLGSAAWIGLGWWAAAPEAPTAGRPGLLGAGIVLAGAGQYPNLGDAVLVALIWAPVAAGAFRLPGRIAADTARWAPDDAALAYQEARGSWLRACAGALLLTAAVGAAAWAIGEAGRARLGPGLLALVVVGVVARSLRDAARTPDDVAVGTLPRLGEVGPALAYLRRHGVEATVRGVGIRRFWPLAAHVPLELRVAPADVERATAALASIGPPLAPWQPASDPPPPPADWVAPAGADEGVWPGPRVG